MTPGILEVADWLGMAAWNRRPRPAGVSPTVDARLRATYVPKLHHPAPAGQQHRPGRFHGHVYVPGFPPADQAGAGLVCCAEFGQRDVPPNRYGLKGLPPNGSRQIRRGCGVLEERRRTLSFWTITLPTPWLMRMLRLDSWPRFQNAIRHRLARLLRSRGLEPLVVGVVELHPKRSREAGQAMPHLHVVFQGRRRPSDGWAVSPSDLDAVILQAAAEAGVRATECPAAGQVEMVRQGVGRYLTKYLTKATRQSVAGMGGAFIGDPRLCPRQWWFMTAPLKALVDRTTVKVPADWLAWLIDSRQTPQKGAPWVVQSFQPPDPRAPACWIITWRSPATMVTAWEAYEAALWLGRQASVRYGRPPY